jgi:hypothetical protein
MSFSKKDNVFTIQLPGSNMVFTRYLYIKEEVRIALLVSILNKSDDAIFWAYELYYSGFKYELLNLIWQIYYDFFATLNPTYEAYFLKKYKEFSAENNPNDERTICAIIKDLLFRPFNTDVFVVRNLVSNFVLDIIYHHDTEKITDTDELRKNVSKWVQTNDFRSIAQFIDINTNVKLEDIYSVCLDVFEITPKNKYMKEFTNILQLTCVKTNVILLAKIMTLFSKKAGLKKGRSIYIHVEPEDIIPYETIIGSQEIKHYDILEKAYICGIDDFKHLSLFKLTRHKYNIQEEYRIRWLYHASFSPLWAKRIKDFGGYPDYTKQTIIFKEEPDDDLMQQFYVLYGLEPDEQKIEVQNKSIAKIEKINNWSKFYEKYMKNGLIEVYDEELEEFDNEGIIY